MAGPESRQGEFPLNIPKETGISPELSKKVGSVFDEYVRTALPVLYTMVANGEGKQELEVFVDEGGKKGEKRRVIDLTAHHLFSDIVKRQTDLPSVIFSEEDVDNFLPKDVAAETKFVAWSFDPIENSSPFAKGIEGARVFSIATAFDQDGNVIMGIAIDLEKAKVLVSKDGKNIMQTYEMVEKANGNPKHKEFIMKMKDEKDPSKGFALGEEEVFPSNRKTLTDPDAAFYTFMGEKEWGILAINNFLPKLYDILDAKTHSELSRGGSHIYPFYLAAGRGEGYAIEKEPITEIYPAWAAITTARLTIFGVKKDGGVVQIKFNPREFLRNPKSYQEECIDFLVVGVTPEIAEQLKTAYLEQLAANEIKEAKLVVADRHPEEVQEVLQAKRASRQ